MWLSHEIFPPRKHRHKVEFGENDPQRRRASPLPPLSTVLLLLILGNAASQWTCRARARDTRKANSYQSICLRYLFKSSTVINSPVPPMFAGGNLIDTDVAPSTGRSNTKMSFKLLLG